MAANPAEQPESFPPAHRPALEGAGVPGKTARFRPFRAGGCLSETIFVLTVALILSVTVKTFFLQTFFIPSSSMETTLLINDRVVVNKFADSAAELNRGDVVVFVDPGGWLPEQPEEEPSALNRVLTFIGVLPQNAGEHLIKRVIGLPGDKVECCSPDGLLTVNGQPVIEPYLRPGVVPSEVEFSVTVPEGSLWVMGDNRQGSRDSRAHLGSPGGGFVPEANLEGRATYLVFPFERMRWLGGEDAAFSNVPEP